MSDFSSQTRHRETKRFKDIEELRSWLAEDFSNFVLYANAYERLKTGKIQLHLAKKLMEGHRVLEFLIFRNSTKTWITDMWIAWKLLCYPGFRIIILSSKHDAGRRHMNNLKRLFSTLPALAHLTWSRSTEKSFSIDGWQGQDETLMIESIFSKSVTGAHPHIVCLDDVAILETEETESKRRKLRELLAGKVYPLVLPINNLFKDNVVPTKHVTQILYTGTPWVGQSILLFDPDKSSEDQEGADEGGHPLIDAHKVIIPAVNEKNESNFPEKFTRVQLEMIKRGMSKESWGLHFMMDPTLLDKEALVIDIENMIEKRQQIAEPIACIDPAGEEGTGDEHGLCIAGSYFDKEKKKNQIHICGLYGYNQKANDFVNTALQKCKDAGVWKIYIESRFSGYRTLFENKIAEMGNFAAIESYNPVGNKHRRLKEVLDPNINNGMVTFEPEVLKDKATMKQFKNFTYKNLPDYDDRLDALAMSISLLLDSVKQASEWTLDIGQINF